MSRLRLGLSLVLLLTLTALSVSIHAQDAPPRYRLRVPPVEEYLTAIPGILALWREDVPDYYTKSHPQPLVNALITQMHIWYSDDDILNQGYTPLRSAFAAFKEIIRWPYPSYIDEPQWLIAIVKAWLRENPIDLNDYDSLSTEAFTAEVRPIDFDGDGQNEFHLVFVDNYALWRTDLILRTDAGSPEGYVVSAPYEWDAQDSFSRDYMHEEFRDITGDGDLEWIRELLTGQPGMVIQCTQVLIHSWQNDRLVSALTEPIRGCESDSYGGEIDLDFGNLDADEWMELQADIHRSDVWGCTWVDRQIFEWYDERFNLISRKAIPDDTLGCAMQQAEPLMWENRAVEALPIYQHGLEVGWRGTEYSTSFQEKIAAYARLRLALANAFTGRIGDALTQLDELRNSPDVPVLIREMATVTRNAPSNAIGMCSAVYNFWKAYRREEIQLPDDYLVSILGRDSVPVGIGESSVPQDPKRVGCNAEALIDGLLTAYTFPSNRSPVEQLESLGFEVASSQSYDLDHDQQPEWLIWPMAEIDPIYFVPSENHYVWSRPSIRREDSYTRVFSQVLPGQDNGSVIVDWVYLDELRHLYVESDHEVSSWPCLQKEQDKYVQIQGDVRIWRLQDARLEMMLTAPLCTKRMPDELFSNQGRELHAAGVVIHQPTNYFDLYSDMAYRWSERQQTYLPPVYLPPPTESTGYTCSQGTCGTLDVPIEPVRGILADGLLFDTIALTTDAYGREDFLGSLLRLDDAIARADNSAHHVIVYALHYWRGMTLEALERPDEALAEYMAIIEAAPESAWGRLAALHVEVVE